jgi:thiamine-monophosphate kinase
MPFKLSEFDVIKTYFEGLGFEDALDLSVGIGDDCAVLDVPEGQSLCFSMDTMVEGVHFPKGAPADKLANRVLAAATSDLAAMGAQPSHFSMSLTLPAINTSWLSDFSRGLKAFIERFRMPLLGGDTTRGPLAITVQVHGYLPKGSQLTRAHAQVGDVLAVSGSLGDAGAALELLEAGGAFRECELFLLDRYYYPSPRIDQGIELRRLASACIDISDGLLADARHIAQKSGVCVEIDLESLPISAALNSYAGARSEQFAVSSGDDYELLFTISEENWSKLKLRDSIGMFTLIGRVTNGRGQLGLTRDGESVVMKSEGFKHFE